MTGFPAEFADTDLEGLKPQSVVIKRVREGGPMFIYFPAYVEKDSSQAARTGVILKTPHPGHVGWMIEDRYVSLYPNRKIPLTSVPEKETRNGQKSFKDGVIIKGLRPPFSKNPKDTAVVISKAMYPNYQHEWATYQKVAHTISMGESLNLSTTKEFTDHVYNKLKWKTPYLLHDATLLGSDGEERGTIKRSNCISMALALFVAGLYGKRIPAAFLKRYPEFNDAQSYIGNHGVKSALKYIRYPKFYQSKLRDFREPGNTNLNSDVKAVAKKMMDALSPEFKAKQTAEQLAALERKFAVDHLAAEKLRKARKSGDKFEPGLQYVRQFKVLVRDYKQMWDAENP